MTSGYGSTYDAKQDRITESEEAVLQKRVERIQAMFIVFHWEKSEVFRDGCSRFNGRGWSAKVDPRQLKVTFWGAGSTEHIYSIRNQMFTIEKFIETQKRPAEEPTKLPIITVDEIEAVCTLLPNGSVELTIHDGLNYKPIKLALNQLVTFRNQLTGIINVIREKHGL